MGGWGWLGVTGSEGGGSLVLETGQSLRYRFSGHGTGRKNPFADNRCKILGKHFGVGLSRNANYMVNIIEK